MDPLEAATEILASFQSLSDALVAQPRAGPTRRGVSTMKADLSFHRDNFKENLESWLGLLADEEGEATELCENPRDEKWKDPDLCAAIRREYARSYERIQYTMEEMSALLLDIRTGLEEAAMPSNRDESLPETLISDGDQAQIIPNPETSNSHARADPFISPKSREIRKQLFDRFGEYNDRLKGLVCADKASPAQVVVSSQRRLAPSTIGKPVMHFWRNAKTLYEFISRSWRCRCHELHHTNLLLQHRTNSEVEFNVLFLFEGGSIDTPQPWTWQDITLKPAQQNRGQIIEAASQGTTEEVPVTQRRPQPKKHGFRDLTRSALKVGKAIAKGFRSKHKNTELHSSPNPPTSTRRTVAFSDIEQPRTHTTHQDADLCATFKAHRLQQQWFQVLTSGDASYLLSPESGFDGKLCIMRNKRSLGNLLNSGELDRRKCCFIALVLASSVYQLHSSPWLQTSWNQRQVMFFSSFTDATQIVTDKPFLSLEYIRSNSRGTVPLHHGPGDLVVESLGIALLELCFGRTLETFPQYQGIPSHSFSRGLAGILLKKAYDYLGDEFAETIKWCLMHRQVDPGDDSWRNELFHNVITPLYYIYHGMPSSDTPSGTGDIIQNGDIKDGGVGILGNPQFRGGTNYFGGTHVTYVYASGSSGASADRHP